MRHLLGQREHYLRNYLRKLGSRERSVTSPMRSSVGQWTMPRRDGKKSRSALDIFDESLTRPGLKSFSVWVTLRFRLSRDEVELPSTGVKWILGKGKESSVRFTLRLPFVAL